MGTNRPVHRGWGLGVKDEINVLEPNNQHVDVFTGWPNSMGLRDIAGHWLSGRYGGTVPPCWLMHELCCLLQMKNNNNNKMESYHEVSTTVCSLFEQESKEGLSVCVCVCVFSDCMISTVISCLIS